MNEYDKISVHYCMHCLYLGNPDIKTIFNQKIECCPYCNGTDFNDISIEEWEEKFERKYKQGKFLKLKKSWKEIMEE